MHSGKEVEYTLEELIDIEAFKQILDNFYKATNIPNAIVAKNGKILTQSDWSKACSKFHRENMNSNQYCLQSNIELIQGINKNGIFNSACKNGLVDYATPIIIENKQLATLFLGQVLHKSPNMKFFISQAAKFNYDKDEYLEAINDIPIVTKEKMESLISCILEMIQVMVKNSLSKLRENVLEENLRKTSAEQIELKDILDYSPIGIGWANRNGKFDYVNHKFTEFFGYTIEDIPTLSAWFEKAFPEKEYQDKVILPWNEKVLDAYKNNNQPPVLEVTVTCKDGTIRRILLRISWIGEKRLSYFNDITEHWKSELRNRRHDRMLEMVTKGAPISEILNNIINTIETEDTSSMCSILLLSEDKKHLLLGASCSLPDFYNEAINGVEIGVGVGSCGTAAYLKQRIIVENIMDHEYWKEYKELAEKANLKSCWSEPILSSNGEVLGTFAIYHTKPTSPTESDFERIKFASNLASIAIENKNTRKELEYRAYYDFLTNLPNRRHYIEQSELELSRNHRFGGALSVIMYDIDHFKLLNDKYGHNIGDLVLKKIADISRSVLRDIDIIGRIGGEEFAISLPCTDISEAKQIAERLRIEISKGEINLEKETLSNFTASFGVATNSDNYNIYELLNFADIALYEAKASGRNRVCIHSNL
jgi:diguanylate cyclase (GGDEF)-like protein/PAS domain S-box-containing protein